MGRAGAGACGAPDRPGPVSVGGRLPGRGDRRDSPPYLPGSRAGVRVPPAGLAGGCRPAGARACVCLRLRARAWLCVGACACVLRVCVRAVVFPRWLIGPCGPVTPGEGPGPAGVLGVYLPAGRGVGRKK